MPLDNCRELLPLRLAPPYLPYTNYSTGETYQYSYDPVGNRLEQVINGDTTAYLYDAANRLFQVDGQSYTFDANGNLLQTGVMTNSWDAANRLIETERAGTTLEPIYNGVGDRVGQVTAGVTTTFALDIAGGLPEVIYTSEGNAYLHLPGVIVAESSTRETHYLLADGLGSIRQAVDENGVVVAYNEFDPYGNPVQNESSPYGFTGEWWEAEVGLLQLRARWYLPEDGVFLSRDPFEGVPYNPATLNNYNYSNQNPINLTDPSGLTPLAGGPVAACLQMPACAEKMATGGLAIAIISPPAAAIGGAVLVLVGISEWICSHTECFPRTVEPIPAPTAPPIDVPPLIGTPPAPCYWSADGCKPVPAIRPQPSGTPAPGPTRPPLPFRLPTETCTPTPTPTSTPDPDKVRLYHGTRWPASSFVAIDVSRGDGQYGPGFYTTLDRNTAKWFSKPENWGQGPGPEAIVWADVPRQWILEARRLTDEEDRALSLRGDWRYEEVPVPPNLEYLMTDYDIIYGPIAGLEPSKQYKFNAIPTAQAKVNSVTWYYEPLQ